MTKLIYRTTPMALVFNIIWAVGLASICNGIIFYFDWGGISDTEVAPPGLGWVEGIIGIVWIVLFVFMAIARWWLLKSEHPRSDYHAWLVTGFIIFCALYPFLTLGFRRIPSLIGNIVTIILAAWVMFQIRPSSTRSAVVIGTVLAWVAFATVYLVQVIRINT